MLSVVVASRNDNHGQDLLARTQTFINSLADQALRFKRPVELVLVDWNPPADAPRLSSVLRRPAGKCFTARTITVANSRHMMLAGSRKLRFFQMLAKNVGIRRSAGSAILATNVDILLSDELFLDSTEELVDRSVHRADRIDIPFDRAYVNEPQRLLLGKPLRINRRTGIYYPDRGRVYPHVRGMADLIVTAVQDPIGFFRRVTQVSANGGPPSFARYKRAFLQVLVLPRLHLNACGDFTLMSRRSWYELRGYPEWEMFSWNLDSLLLYQAAAARFRFVEFEGHPAFHMDHSGGWSPESQRVLFDRLEEDGVPVLTDRELLDVAAAIWSDRRKGTWKTNLSNWGMAADDLQETDLRSA